MVLYGDETDLHLNPDIQEKWQEKGKQDKIETPRKNEKSHAFGAINPVDGRTVVKLSDKKRSQEFIEFLKLLLSIFIGKKIFLIVDNFGIHKTSQVKKFLDENIDRIELVFLPTYSPHLNLMENVWRTMRTKILKNKLYPSMDKLKETVVEYFKILNSYNNEGVKKEAA